MNTTAHGLVLAFTTLGAIVILTITLRVPVAAQSTG
jgi:hypothetical protein